jgi:uncharacterized NAD(P)/FAD-binding protein YdhS
MSEARGAPPLVAIVGSGFSGTMVAAHLLREASEPLAVALIERGPSAGGVAYRTDDPGHLLNVPAGGMSAFPDVPDHFLDWARARAGGETGPDSFLPRRLYGEYLAAILDEAAASSGGGRLERLRDEAVSVRPGPCGAEVRLRSGRVLHARRVALALGNFIPASPLPPGSSLAASPRYVPNPWAPGALAAVSAGDPVVLIGAGLSMADLVSTLAARGHRAPIHALSRRGLRLQPHAAGSPYPPFLLPGSAPRTTRALLRAVRDETRSARARGRGWREVLDSLRPHVPALWRSLDEAEQARFLRHVRVYWDAHRHRLPPTVFGVLEGLRAAGRLNFLAARIVSARAAAGGVELELRRRGAAAAEVLRATWAINCTGPRGDLEALDEALVADLLRRGLISPDAHRLGARTGADGALLDADGRASDVLFTLGPPRRGTLWESTAVPELRAQAAALARRLGG